MEKLVEPTAVDDDACLKEIDAGELPLLLGYVATTAKEAARTILVADSGDPLLARWRYGLGQTAAFTSETKPRWAEDWIDWPDFAKFWSQLVRSITVSQRDAVLGIECSHRTTDLGTVVSADVRDPAGGFLDGVTVTSSLVDEQGRSKPLAVGHGGPGLFEVQTPPAEYGKPQQMVWTVAAPAGEPVPVSYGFVESFSPEFSTLGIDERALNAIAKQGRGQLMSVGQSRLAPGTGAGAEQIPLWPLLLAAALLAIPADILCRRLG